VACARQVGAYHDVRLHVQAVDNHERCVWHRVPQLVGVRAFVVGLRAEAGGADDMPS
jgi:hypothetical protein